ncbi:MAG: putative lipopolysaccharide biosynthesis protein [Myxococcales bacterium]|nr:putative lipopolysaccharide biosynthesis protein [Myxococcales bacterium]
MTDRRLQRDIVWNLVPVVLLGVVGLGLNFAIAAWWDAAALGVFNQVTAAFFIMAVLAAGGLQFSVLRAVAAKPEDPARVAAVVVGALVPTVVLGSLCSVAFVVLRWPVARWLDSDDVATGMLWSAPGLLFFGINKVLLGVVNGLRRMRAFAVYTSLRYSLIAIGLVAAWVGHLESNHLAGIWAFSEGGLLLVLIVELLSTVALRCCAGWTAWTREHLSYGARGVVATLAFEVNQKLDVWLLGVALSDAQVGIYSLAAALAEGALQLSVVVQNNVNPLIARDLAEGRKTAVEELVRRTRRWFVPALVAICIVASCLYPVTIPWVIRKHEFIAGALPFAILMGGIALSCAYLPFNTIPLMAGLPGWQTGYVVVVLAINCMTNLALVPRFGLAGAAIGSAAALASSAMLLRWLVRKRIGVRI